MELEKALNGLKKTKVRALVIKKKKNNIFSRFIGGCYGGVFCRFRENGEGDYFFDFIRARKETYDIAKEGDVLALTAYRGMKNQEKLYLRPDEALLN